MRKIMTFMVALAFLGTLALPAMAGVSVDGEVKAELLLSSKCEETNKDDVDGNIQFQNVKAKLNFNGDVADGVKALVELRTSDVATGVVDSTINDSGFVTAVNAETKRGICIRQALIELTNLIPNAALRIGRLRIPFAGSLESDDSMSNPLINGDIGFSDAETVDEGVDCTMNFNDMFSAALGVFNGPEVYNPAKDQTENNDKLTFVVRGVGKPIEGLTVTGEYYTSDNTSDSEGAPNDKINAYEIIGQYQVAVLAAKGIYGNNTTDNGTTKPSTSYMGAQGSYDINEMIWVAGRFVKSTLDHDDATKEDTETTEMAIGGGINLAENTKVKVQYQSVKTDNLDGVKGDEKTESGVKAEIITAF